MAPAGHWTLPGCGVEFGEQPTDAALRELRQEAVLTGRIAGRPNVHSRTLTLDRGEGSYELHSVRIVYRVKIVGGEPRNEIGGSTERFQWFRPR